MLMIRRTPDPLRAGQQRIEKYAWLSPPEQGKYGTIAEGHPSGSQRRRGRMEEIPRDDDLIGIRPKLTSDDE